MMELMDTLEVKITRVSTSLGESVSGTARTDKGILYIAVTPDSGTLPLTVRVDVQSKTTQRSVSRTFTFTSYYSEKTINISTIQA